MFMWHIIQKVLLSKSKIKPNILVGNDAAELS